MAQEDEPKAFQPSTVEANRARQQGLGLGRRELEAQHDSRVSDTTDEQVERLEPEDDGPPTGAQHGQNNTRRPRSTEVARGQGPKTLAANRERVKGSPKHTPR